MKKLRIAVMSDIHGNLAALDAVLADLERRTVDTVVNLGDIVSGPLDPVGTANRLMPLGLPTIRGNHDRQLLTLPPGRMGQSDRQAGRLLTAAMRAWLASLQPTLRLANDVLLCHGTVESDLDYLLEHVEEDGARPATRAEVESRARNYDASLILCGHSHVPRTLRLAAGQLVVNLLRTVVENCLTKCFLANPDLDAARAKELFHLNDTEVRPIELQPRRQFLLKRPDAAKVLELQVDPCAYWIYTNTPLDNQQVQRATVGLPL